MAKIIQKLDTSELRVLFRKAIRNSSNIGPALEAIKEDLKASIDENFIRQGRPKRWKPLKRSTIKKRRLKQQTGTKILQASGGLATSITGNVRGNKIILGSPKEYARIHNEGGTIRHPGGTKYAHVGPGEVRFLRKSATKFDGITKPHNIKIPARPFLLFQKKDIREARETLADHLLKGLK